jgi:hypothetical protein
MPDGDDGSGSDAASGPPDDPEAATDDVEVEAEAGADPDADADRDPVIALAAQEAWHAEGYAARVHYSGAGRQYSIEFYGPSEAVVYWAIDESDGVAVPVPRRSVPDPLRERVRTDLEAAGIDPALERDAL